MTFDSRVPALRVRVLRDEPPEPKGRYVLYWMTGQRRLSWNFALERAAEWSRHLGRPLLVFEALRARYPYASPRLHRFVLEGMRDHASDLERRGIRYLPYVERRAGEGRGLLRALSRAAAVTVGDDAPVFFLPRMLRRAAEQVAGRLEAVDSNGLLPLRAAPRVFPTAHAFRRFLQQSLRAHLDTFPREDPLRRLPGPPASVPQAVLRRFRPVTPGMLDAPQGLLDEVFPRGGLGPGEAHGGRAAARRRLRAFLHERLDRYAEERNHPDLDAASGLSPYLHFGHISTHEVFAALASREDWSPVRLSARADGSRTGWWGMSVSAEAFLDQLVTWRELGFNFAAFRDDAMNFESLPEWARKTLAQHASDPRPRLYSLESLAASETDDTLWNAAQTQLREEGRLHNYLRMVWGKRLLEWTPSPEIAMAWMAELNDRYALDGRDPNSASGIGWVLGRYDRAWGPERPIFGKVRYMSSENTVRKLKMKRYLERYGRKDRLES